MKQEISVNVATTKKFILATGQRASKDGVFEMQKNINKFAATLADKAKDVSISKRCKTILGEHVQEAMNQCTKIEEVDEIEVEA